MPGRLRRSGSSSRARAWFPSTLPTTASSCASRTRAGLPAEPRASRCAPSRASARTRRAIRSSGWIAREAPPLEQVDEEGVGEQEPGLGEAHAVRVVDQQALVPPHREPLGQTAALERDALGDPLARNALA